VSIDGQEKARIGPGLVVLLGVGHHDGEQHARALAEKTVYLRVFADGDGKTNLSALDVGADVLVISQFTLYADTRRGRRPSFTDAAPPDIAAPLVERFADFVRSAGLRVGTGVFGAHMLVEIHNDGPVTILLETPTAPPAGAKG
jgi:D-aminoacyl-tRNA deacylase